MANDLVLPPPPAWLQVAGDGGINTDLTEGVGESFPILSIRSGKFFIKFQGAEKPYLSPQGYNSPTIDVVIVKANSFLTKAWYMKGYQQGDRDAPDCKSSDGKSPDADSEHTPINPTTGQRFQFCGPCPNNIFGSAPVNAEGQGGRGKACSDGRRIVVLLPPHALDGQIMPVLLRVPPTSLKPLADYGSKLERARYPYHAVSTRLSFATVDHKGRTVGHPLLHFEEVEVLPQSEFEFVNKLRMDPQVDRILNSRVTGENADMPRPDIVSRFDQQTQSYSSIGAEPGPTPSPVVVAAAAPVAQPKVDLHHVVKTAAAGTIALPDGRFFDPATGQFVPPPEPPKPARPATVIDLPDGKMFDTASGQYWVGEAAATPQPQAAPPAAVVPLRPEPEVATPKRASTGFLGAAVAPPSQAQQEVTPPTAQPTAAEAKAKVVRPKKMAAQPEAEAAPATNGNGTDKTVTSAPSGLDSIIASLKGSGVPPE